VTPEQAASRTYTIEHFKEIARLNRFAENGSFSHDEGKCTVCRPGLLDVAPLAVYLEVVTESIKVRRPGLDEALVAEINKDLEFMGEAGDLSKSALLAGEPRALNAWSGWVREALATGLALLSMHSSTSREFTLEEADARGQGRLVEDCVNEIIAYQKQHA
jgi:hypothetical protein